MHLQNIPVPLLVVVSSLCGSSLALPFLWRRTPTAEALALAARPTYSVVPIDGSGGQGGDADVTLTVTVTSAPTTIIESSPPVTKTVTVSGKPTTRTISIIDIEPTTEFVTTTLTATPTPTPTATSTPTSYPVTSVPPISTSSIPSTTSGTSMGSSNATMTSSFTVSIPTSGWATSTSYESGSWHTTYPAWNSTFTRRFAQRSWS